VKTIAKTMNLTFESWVETRTALHREGDEFLSRRKNPLQDVNANLFSGAVGGHFWSVRRTARRRRTKRPRRASQMGRLTPSPWRLGRERRREKGAAENGARGMTGLVPWSHWDTTKTKPWERLNIMRMEMKFGEEAST
jgi:hypothetical protein